MLEQTVKKLVFNYYIVFVLLVLTAIAGYLLQRVVIIDSFSKAGVLLQTINVLVLMICIPTSLKVFATKVGKLKELENEEEKLSGYLYWSKIRLIAIATPLLLSVLLHCIVRSSDNNYSMIFCAGMAGMALIFCKPLKKRVKEELGI